MPLDIEEAWKSRIIEKRRDSVKADKASGTLVASEGSAHQRTQILNPEVFLGLAVFDDKTIKQKAEEFVLTEDYVRNIASWPEVDIKMIGTRGGIAPAPYNPNDALHAIDHSFVTLGWSPIATTATPDLPRGSRMLEVAVEISAPLDISVVAAVRRVIDTHATGLHPINEGILSTLVCPDYFSFPEMHRPVGYTDAEWDMVPEEYPGLLTGEMRSQMQESGEKLSRLVSMGQMTVDIVGTTCPYCGYRRNTILLPISWFAFYDDIPLAGTQTKARLNMNYLSRVIHSQAIENYPAGTLAKLKKEVVALEAENQNLGSRLPMATTDLAKRLTETQIRNKKLEESLSDYQKHSNAQARKLREVVAQHEALSKQNNAKAEDIKTLTETIDKLTHAQARLLGIAGAVAKKYGGEEIAQKIAPIILEADELIASIKNPPQEEKAWYEEEPEVTEEELDDYECIECIEDED